MVFTGKPVPPTKAKPSTEIKPIAIPASVVRHSIPPLSPLPAEKPAAPGMQAVVPVAPTATQEKANQLASTEPQPTAGPTSPAKPTETLGPKLRAKGEIIAALRAGAHVLHTESGLYRIVAANGTVSPASKRRILALIQQGILKASGEAQGRIYIRDAEAEKKASEKKPVAKPALSATTKAESTK